MTNLWKCRACGGVYCDSLADGSVYFHVCAPIFDERIGEMITAPNARNECIHVDARLLTIGILAEGAGVDPVPPNKLNEPAWLTKLKEQVKRLEVQDD